MEWIRKLIKIMMIIFFHLKLKFKIIMIQIFIKKKKKMKKKKKWILRKKTNKTTTNNQENNEENSIQK